MNFTTSGQDLKNLEQAGLVHFVGISGLLTDAATALQVPGLVRMHAFSGKVFDVARLDVDEFQLTEVQEQTPKNAAYAAWMDRLNELAPGQMFLRNRLTWRAFCQGIEPERYLQGYGRGR